MAVAPLVLQTAGSLVAILALAGLARWMKLGGSPRLDSEQAVRRAAGEVEDGFEPIAIARDAEGYAALARDARGRIMVIRRHGNRFAGRVLGPGAAASSGAGMIDIDCGEVRFGPTRLAIAQAEAWAAAINRLDRAGDA